MSKSGPSPAIAGKTNISQLPTNKSAVRALRLTLVVYTIILALKLTVYALSGVIVLLAEALHTLSDIFISGFLLLAMSWSEKSADEEHMFGHGRADNIAALVAATLFVSFTSFKLYEESVPHILRPETLSHQNLSLVIAVLGVSILIAALPLVNLIRQRTDGAAAKAQLMELINDELGLIAALIGTVFIMTGHPIADPIAAVFVATIIAVNGIRLFIDNFSLLLGRSPGNELMAEIEKAARSVEGVLDVHGLKAELVGSDTVHADLHLVLWRGLDLGEADRISEEVRARIYEIAARKYCVIHLHLDAAEMNGRLIHEDNGTENDGGHHRS